MQGFRLLLAAAPLAAVAACSPYTYSKEVADIDANVKKLAASVNAGHQAVVDDQTAHYRRMLILNQSAVVVAPNCALDPPRVDPYVTPTPEEKAAMAKAAKEKAAREKAGGTPPEEPAAKPARQPCDVYLPGDLGKTPAQLAMVPEDRLAVPPKLVKAMKAISDYTGALAAVTNAADRTNFDAAYGKLATSVSGIFVAAGGAAPIGALAGAGINLFGWLLGNALDIQRFEALKAGVNAVDKPLKAGGNKAFFLVVITMATKINALAERRRGILVKDMFREKAELRPGLGEETYRSRLADLQAMAAALEGLNQADAMSAANDLMKAHDELVDAVNNPKLDIAGLIKTIGELNDKVSALQSALAAASTPAAAAKTPAAAAKKGA